MDVTCVIPTHDRFDRLKVAVASVLTQTTKPAALVISDDCGSVDVREWVKRLDATFPIVYVDSSRGGEKTAGASRNAGAAHANTDLIAFLDDDDQWEPGFLELAVGALAASGAALCVTWGRLVRDGITIGGVLKMPSTVDRRRVVARNPGITGSNLVVRRTVFESIGGFDSALPVMNDMDLFVRILDAGFDYVTVPTELVTQFSHQGAQLSTQSARRASGIRRYLAKHGPSATLRARRMLRHERYMAERYQRPQVALFLYFVLSWLSAEPADLIHAVGRRLRTEPRAYR